MCNLLDGVGTDFAHENRKVLSVINFLFVFIGFICGCCAAAGGFRSADIIHSLPWMTWEPANFTVAGYTDINGTMVPEYVANHLTNPEIYYSNLWGTTDADKKAKIAWKDYPGVPEKCADCYEPMLWGLALGLIFTVATMVLALTRMDASRDRAKCWAVMFSFLAIGVNMGSLIGIWGSCFKSAYDQDMSPRASIGTYAYVACILVANWPSFIIQLCIPVRDGDSDGSAAEKQELIPDVEKGEAKPEPATSPASEGSPTSGSPKKKKKKKKKKPDEPTTPPPK
jgi:hypothetical protein